MATMERERKFLVRDDSWRTQAVGRMEILQGYFDVAGGGSFRVRIAGDQANLNLKGPARGMCRREFEYPIPVEEARELLALFCQGRTVAKTRHFVPAGEGLQWEIDEYHGPLEGHFTAELEVPREEQPFSRPPWLGEEKTLDPRYANAALARAGKWPGA